MRTTTRSGDSMWRWTVMAAALLAGCDDASSQAPPGQVHETKAAYADFGSWPATAPGSVTLENFQPFRAVYERNYRDMNGQPRRDRVIVAAENVAWGDEAAVMVSLADAGSLEYTDTSARNQFRFFARDDGRLLFQVTPAPGTAKDYAVLRAEEGHVTMNTVRTESGEAEFQEMALGPTGGWGTPPHWAVASLPLEVGMKVRLDPLLALPSSRVFVGEPFLVVGRESVDVLGEPTDAWVVEHPLGLDGPRVMHTWLVDRPPYLLGRQPVDAATGEEPVIGSMRLVAFEAFGDGR